MKYNKTISIDWELMEKCKNINASELINELLLEHFKKLDPKKMNVQELDKAIAKRKAKLDYEQKLKEIE